MNSLSTDNSKSCLHIEGTSALEFREKIEALLLEPPKWVSLHAEKVRAYLDEMPAKLTNYTYAPRCSQNGVAIKFKCTEKKFKLTLKNESVLPGGILQILRKDSKPKTAPNISIGQKSPSNRTPSKSTEATGNRVVYQGPVTSESISIFPEDLQKQAKKYAKSDFPYTATIKSNGSVKVGGSKKYVGKTLTTDDILKQMEKSKEK